MRGGPLPGQPAKSSHPAAAATGGRIRQDRPDRAMNSLLSILLLGFVLGMRHATDADHVVAVATIVSRQRSIRGAAFTGFAWGIGHSIAMLAAGGAIILCGLVI